MKTKNNIQKTIFASLGIGASVVLISATVNAQYYFSALAENHSFIKSEIARVEKGTLANSVDVNNKNAYASFLITENDEPLVLENWMMNDRNFTTSIEINEEVETPLNLEDWMTNEKVFFAGSINLEVENEAALELETWMTNEKNFDVPTFQLIEETDEKLELQDWMFNKSLFESTSEPELPLQMEEWMISEDIWTI